MVEFGEIIEGEENFHSGPGPRDGVEEFGEVIEEPSSSVFQKMRGVPKAIRSAIQTGREYAKGAIKKGAVGVGEALGGTYGDIIQALGPGEEIPRAIRNIPVIPIPTSEEIENLMQRLGIETEPQNVGERFAKKAGQAAGTGLAFGGTGTGALVGGAVAGQTAREAGAPEWLSSLIDVGTTFGKGAIKQKLLPRGKEAKKLVEAGRKFGLSEKEITPLVKGPKGFAIGKAFTRKAAKMEKIQQNIKKKLGDSYNFVKKEAAAEGRLPFKDAKNLDKTLSAQLKELSKTHHPSDAKKKAMEILDDTIRDIHLKGSTYEKLVSSYQDINQQPHQVRKFLEGTKKAFTSELKRKSPELGQDFENVNKLYSNFSRRLAKIKPNEWDKLLDKAGVWGIPAGLVGVAMGKPWILAAALGKEGIRSLGQAFLTEPWLQNLPNKFIHALKVNDKEGAVKLIASFKKLVKKKYDKDLDEEEDYSAE